MAERPASDAPPPSEAEILGTMRRDVNEAVRQLHLAHAISFARPGTISLRLPQGRFAVATLQSVDTPDARPVAVSNSNGALPEDAVVASHDIAALHAVIFAARPAAKAVVVFRGHYLTAWAIAKKPIPVRYFQLLNYTKAAELPVADVDGPDIAAALRRTLDANPDAPCVLLSNGDVVTWSGNIVKAARLAISLDEAAQVTALAERLGGAKAYPPGIPEAIYAALAPYS